MDLLYGDEVVSMLTQSRFVYTEGTKEKNRLCFICEMDLKWEFTIKVDYTLSSCCGKFIFVSAYKKIFLKGVNYGEYIR